MKIATITSEPFHELVYRNTGRNQCIVDETLLFLKAEVDALPNGLQALIVTADLQGREKAPGSIIDARLLGVRVAEELEILEDRGLLPALSTTGVILAGDFYCREDMDRRGGSGDVCPVWEALAERCRWVAGIAGNHDLFGTQLANPDSHAGCWQNNIHYVDNRAVELDGLKIAGLSGIIGNPRRPFRRDEATYIQCLESLLDREPHLLVLHDGPNDCEQTRKGNSLMRETLEAARDCLVVRGHTHWEQPLAPLANGTQVLNVDSRVVVLHPSSTLKA